MILLDQFEASVAQLDLLAKFLGRQSVKVVNVLVDSVQTLLLHLLGLDNRAKLVQFGLPGWADLRGARPLGKLLAGLADQLAGSSH